MKRVKVILKDPTSKFSYLVTCQRTDFLEWDSTAGNRGFAIPCYRIPRAEFWANKIYEFEIENYSKTKDRKGFVSLNSIGRSTFGIQDRSLVFAYFKEITDNFEVVRKMNERNLKENVK